MRNKILSSIFLSALLLFVPALVHAQSVDSISSNTFETNQQIVISGNGLAAEKFHGYLCFNRNDACYTATDSGIVSWTDDEIVFTVPANIDFSGRAYVYGGKSGDLGGFNYLVNPSVLQYISNNQLATEGTAGTELTLNGDAFGVTKGLVKFGTYNAQINSWTNNLIKLTVPAPTSDTNTIVVCRVDGTCSSHEFLVHRKIFDDPQSPQQTYLRAIKYDQAYNLLNQKTPIVVAVIDNGVLLSHPDLKGKFWTNDNEIPNDGLDNDGNGFVDDYQGYNFIDKDSDMTVNGDHGTAVAGVIAAVSNNGVGITGLTENTKIMPLIACGVTECSSLDIIDAVRYAVDNGAQIINLSVATTLTSGYLEYYNQAFKYAYEHNVLVVVAAGNGDEDTGVGRDLDKTEESPVCNDAGLNAVVGVGATDNDGVRTKWSNYGSRCVDVYAPGENLNTLKATGSLYSVESGTSLSAPIIVGLAAQILSAYPDMSTKTLTDFIDKNGPFINAFALFNDVRKNYAGEDIKIPAPKPEPIVQPVTKPKVKFKTYFSDVNSLNTNAAAITYLKEQGIIEGYPDGTFRPTQGVTRAELLKILIKGGLQIEPGAEYKRACFTDVKVDDWFSNYVCYAKSKGWAEGYANGSFAPNKNINKVEAMKFLVEINRLGAAKISFVPYADVASDAWYEKYVRRAFEMGLLEEISNQYRPDDLMTRGSIAESIFRLLTIKASGAESYQA